MVHFLREASGPSLCDPGAPGFPGLQLTDKVMELLAGTKYLHLVHLIPQPIITVLQLSPTD